MAIRLTQNKLQKVSSYWSSTACGRRARPHRQANVDNLGELTEKTNQDNYSVKNSQCYSIGTSLGRVYFGPKMTIINKIPSDRLNCVLKVLIRNI